MPPGALSLAGTESGTALTISASLPTRSRTVVMFTPSAVRAGEGEVDPQRAPPAGHALRELHPLAGPELREDLGIGADRRHGRRRRGGEIERGERGEELAAPPAAPACPRRGGPGPLPRWTGAR